MSISGLRLSALVLALLYALAAAGAEEKSFVPVTDKMLQHPNDGDWLMWRRTLNGWGYSPLKQIDKGNVAQLKQVWSQPMGMGVQESTPLAYAGVVYVPNSGDFVQAFDGKTGAPLWEYRRQYPEGVNGGTNRNIAIWGTTLIDASADNMMYAIDARTGKLVWETKVLEPTLPARPTAGPIVVNGKVITGRQCQPAATSDSCIITAHDAATGKELWRTRTIPRKGEPGDETWGDVPMEQRWHVGTWMVPSYDPDLDRIYVGTSVTIPAAKFILGGVDKQHLYHNSTLALDPATGKIIWYYQHLIDHWDLDHPFERLLVDTAVAPDPREVTWINPRLKTGERRKVITTHDAFGYFADAYGVAFIAPQGLSTEAQPSAREVARIIDQIRRRRIPAVFLENISDPRPLERIATETGAKIGGTLYSDALTRPTGEAPTYIAMMRHNIRVLIQALTS